MRAAPLIVIFALLFGACSAEEGARTPKEDGPKEATISTEEGIVFSTGELVEGHPPFSKTDLYVVTNGPEGPQLKTGATKITEHGSPVNWFMQGGIARKWDSLDQVPHTLPTEDSQDTLQHAKYGNGFLVENFLSSGYTRGFISAATPDSVTIQYEVHE